MHIVFIKYFIHACFFILYVSFSGNFATVLIPAYKKNSSISKHDYSTT